MDNTPVAIGVATEGAPRETWFKIDNFRLTRLAEDALTGLFPDPLPSFRHASTAIYDLSGRKAAFAASGRMQRGIYLRNNKKIFVK